MAKKKTTELSVEDKLKALYQLQTTLSAIDEKRALRGELPLEVQDLEDEIEGLSTRIEKIQMEIEEFQTAVSQKKADIATAESLVTRYQTQLNDVKNNREYDTLTMLLRFIIPLLSANNLKAFSMECNSSLLNSGLYLSTLDIFIC